MAILRNQAAKSALFTIAGAAVGFGIHKLFGCGG
jgi:hypothetical protein